jgi:DNA-binding transcriptional LysR family regulator
MLPVCAADADGKPLFDLEGEGSVPLLAYSAGAFLGRSVNLLLRQRKLRFTTVYETAMADSLKSMALEGLGIAWVPQLSVRAELARGELVVCGAAMACAAGNSPVSLRPGAQGQRAVVVAQAGRRFS